ncbi:MAG: hypothetical protein H6663_10080 [Candidatus Promineofilum sp.]|uniref:hypothetical protein n=1 Tax=Promineifilum sp. TaxID=2664178 RepID=UPI002411F857|nr:hypothetical protein [Promineifilum sp.]MCO5180424.1 hypothetical protein [Promineifilum sp.]
MNNKSVQRAAGGLMVVWIGLLAACGGQNQTVEPTAPAATPAIVETTPVEATAASIEATAVPAEATAAPLPMTRLNLNTVGGDELLATIPGFSARMVREFQEYRPYVSISQFRREIGKYVSDEVVAGYEQYVYVPVDINNADEATLMQLPGVDETVAAALVAGRPYAGNDAFLAALAGQVSAEDAAAAAGYLTTP